MLATFRVLLLGEGIENLLNRGQNIAWVKTTATSGSALADEIKQIRPNVLIADEALQVSELFKMMECLQDYPELRVLIINPIQNSIISYDKKEKLIVDSDDLVGFIQAC